LFYLEASMNSIDFAHLFKPLLLVLLLPPVPWLLLVLIAAGLLRRHRQAGRGLLALASLGLWLSCTEGAAQWLAQRLLKPPPALSTEAIAALRSESRSDVAVLVLGAGARSFVPEYAGPDLKPLSLERLRYGIWLARQIKAPLGFSGGIGWGAGPAAQSEAASAERTAEQEFGLPLKWAEGRSRDTRENASYSVALLKADGIKKLLLVTNDLHMPRSLRAFNQAAMGQIEIIPAPIGAQRDLPTDLQDWCPSNEGILRMRYAVYEWLGSIAGH
jgi:uncharacterized SAM-binding protein YcdF (DUF218 family)